MPRALKDSTKELRPGEVVEFKETEGADEVAGPEQADSNVVIVSGQKGVDSEGEKHRDASQPGGVLEDKSEGHLPESLEGSFSGVEISKNPSSLNQFGTDSNAQVASPATPSSDSAENSHPAKLESPFLSANGGMSSKSGHDGESGGASSSRSSFGSFEKTGFAQQGRESTPSVDKDEFQGVDKVGGKITIGPEGEGEIRNEAMGKDEFGGNISSSEEYPFANTRNEVSRQIRGRDLAETDTGANTEADTGADAGNTGFFSALSSFITSFLYFMIGCLSFLVLTALGVIIALITTTQWL